MAPSKFFTRGLITVLQNSGGTKAPLAPPLTRALIIVLLYHNQRVRALIILYFVKQFWPRVTQIISRDKFFSTLTNVIKSASFHAVLCGLSKLQ